MQTFEQLYRLYEKPVFHPEEFSYENSPNFYGGAPAGSLGFGGSNGAITQKDDIYTVTVKWNNQQETFELKAMPRGQTR